ncbi:amino acid racemase [Candidatus Bathyarchaeota archaeon]|nr:amino acid racemase [Candidatus Bathyarchaeota archaeon]
MVEKIIGIIGGMGPEATADLYLRIIRATYVEKDQDHHRIIIDSNPKIPDRTPAIIGGGENPLPYMTETAKNVEEAGADFLIMPCNTAHYFYEEIQESVDIPLLHMIRLSAAYTINNYKSVDKAGLLATDGTISSKLYHDAYGEQGIEIITPDRQSQKKVMKAIYQHIKRGKLEDGRRIIHQEAKNLIKNGSKAIINGCTEVSIVMHQGDLEIPIVDPLQVLAEEAVKLASGME